MPLIHSAKKQAFEKNLKTEMHAGKPQNQALAIAYATKRKASRKKAAGGTVESGSRDMNMAEGGTISAKDEHRPMPDSTYDDAAEVAHNRAKKELLDSTWTDRGPEEVAHNKPRTEPIKHPKMVPTNAFSARLYDKEGNLQESARPSSPNEQPDAWMNEEGPDRHGPAIHDMEDEHSTHKKPYAKGGEVEKSDYRAVPNKYEDDLLDLLPSHDEGSAMAHSEDEEGQDRQGPRQITEPIHSTRQTARISEDSHMELNPAHGRYSANDSEEQPADEEQEEHRSSIAAAIMARRRMALGGEILEDDEDIHSHGSMDSDDSDVSDLSRNADEDANEEDQTSFDALRKENYSETPGLDELDQPKDSNMKADSEEMDAENQHDMISAIRRKMNAKRRS